MILSRITKHLMLQHWSGVFIELLIVVLGVFIGLQVDNWNAVRVQQQTARVYLERIREDLAANKEDMRQRTAYFTQARNHTLAARAALDRPPKTLGKPFLIDVYQASQILPRTFGRDTYDEILSVGAVNGITDISVRKRLADFYRNIEAPLAILAHVVPYRELIRRRMPYPAQAAIRARCGDELKISATGEAIASLPKSCEIELSKTETSQDVSAIIDADIRDDLVRRISDLDN